MKASVLALAGAFSLAYLHAQANPWQPAEGHTQVALWPGTPPNSKPVAGPEDDVTKSEYLFAGRPAQEINNVIKPTFTVYSPKEKNTGAAVIVFPGGGYRILAIDLEGTEVCDWLTNIGVTCVLLKYRVPGSGPNWDPKRKKHLFPKIHTALQDAQRAMSLVRHRAAEWKLDPHRIGVLGFSAGGHLVAAISTQLEREYKAVDEADKESFCPDFAVALYPGHMLKKSGVRVTSQTPPTMLIHAQDDAIVPVENSLTYYAALRKAKVPVEMHLFAQGQHAFGLRPTEFPITKWPALAETWLRTIGMISKSGN